ncbi:MAG TPA: Type 1 glutamine amidotransferase-like domain-containing protein [Candidatus Saccharimonadales bacterium]|nr:Type 1 glutamine amidotransferase-like domain-containing protein [Candidatus Saccharimonadales bacterium]
MTKYILHGGDIRNSSDEGKAFFTDMVDGLVLKPKVLMCFFAQPKSIWNDKYMEWRVRIAASVPRYSVQFGMADLKDFKEQSEKYDVLFVYGGDASMLIEALRSLGNYREVLDRFKVVAGSSAGAIMLSKFGWDCNERKVVEGLGFVPAKVLVHFESETYGKVDDRGPIDWQKAWDEMAAFDDPALPILELHEGEFESYG